ncbi:IbpA Molecular chaperone (small heat shock protein) [uncultured Caudovirales phage]|jgi:molecular chaperone IbpA|uniref:IbpA Molecular chaperone (Small heat shock protein) n=1 Tax=uncultured Caudovirales phage TaxID=2100421 RepID=A0A6J7WGQ6_9CAUD|nr:IbpA Molecular chaperone (small heat shock protein) [uncultured Caudovirales phage]
MTQFQIHTLDLPALHRHAIGFDNLFEQLNRTFANSKSDGNYPPHNVVKLDDTHYVIELAVAGFSESEIDVELKENVLTVKGERVKSETEIEYLHRGISARNFIRTFPLAEHIEVRGATVQNGILAIALEQVIPEEQKAKKIQITFAK